MPGDCRTTGVHHPEGKPWRGRVKALGAAHHLGYFETEAKARWAEIQFAKGIKEIFGVDD